MKSNTVKLTGNKIPECLRNISSPPKQLYCRGAPLGDLLKHPRIAIVGSRGPSVYGKQVTTQLARQLAEQGIVIVSGLALGVDALAHQASVEVGGPCIAVLPGSVERIYPRTNLRLSEEILARGGALVSEYDDGEISYKQNFIARNRLVAGMAHATLITEAGEKSGSLYTARFAREQNKQILAVPGNITSKLSAGSNDLLKRGAKPITGYRDVLRALDMSHHKRSARKLRGRNAGEQTVLDLLLTGLTAGDELLRLSRLSTSEFNQILTMLEIDGKIHPLGANHWSLC